jgi:hypothetical protein
MADMDKDKATVNAKDNQLDALLDSMLAEYSAVEPRPGLENRILTNIREATGKEKSPWWRWRWIWAGAAAAAVALIIAVMLLSSPGSRKQPVPVAQGNSAQENSGTERGTTPHVANAAPERAAVPSHPTAVAHAPRMQTVARKEVRREVFPTPEPLSKEERMLLSYLSRTPREELVAQSHPDPTPDEDLLQGPQGVFNPATNSRNSANSN